MSRIVCRCVRVAFTFAALIVAQAAAHAATYTFSSVRDATLLQGLPDLNFGGLDFIQTGTSVSAPTRSVIQFDVTGLAGDLDVFIPNTGFERVNSVTMRLFVQGFDGASTKITEVYAASDANASWVEGTSGGGVQVGSSAWNYQQYNTLPWAGSPGLSTVGADYNGTLLSSQTFASDPGAGAQIDFTFTGSQAALTALIKHWAEVQNAGLLMLDPNQATLAGAFDRVRYFSREATNPLFRPLLIVDTVILPVPEPSTCLLIGLGLAAVLPVARRRLVRGLAA